MSIMDDNRPFFRQLRDRHHFNVAELAHRAGTHEIVVISMLRNKPVYRAQAEKVLNALSKMTKLEYSLKNVHVPLITGKIGEGEASYE